MPIDSSISSSSADIDICVAAREQRREHGEPERDKSRHC